MFGIKEYFKDCKDYIKDLLSIGFPPFIFNNDHYNSFRKINTISKIVLYKIYKESKPKANFYRLIRTSPLKDNKICIPFMEYYIEEEKMDEIIQKELERFKLNEYFKRKVSELVYLGPSPTSVDKNKEYN